jgi:hypothetical protein
MYLQIPFGVPTPGCEITEWGSLWIQLNIGFVILRVSITLEDLVYVCFLVVQYIVWYVRKLSLIQILCMYIYF